MAGLIPLMLSSSSRTSYIVPSQTSPRRQSACSSPSSTSPTTPTHPARPMLPKRLSIPAPAPVPVLPCTRAEWRKTIGEVKRKYFSKRYRACSARCLEVLDGVKDTSHVEPVYLIYLHFYAATSMEICARPLPSTSALRTSLLQQARTHFDHASTLINAAEESVLRRFRPGSVTSSRGSSCHSPSGSVSSRAWTPDTRVSSPTDSVCSFDNPLKSPQAPPKRVKKVSFSLPKDAPIHIPAEPIIRPDSPTLGFDGGFFQPTIVRQDLPEALQPPPKFQEIEMPLQTIPENETEQHITPDEVQTLEHQQQPDEEYDDDAVPPSLARCCEHLSSLRAQLTRHSASLHQQLVYTSQQQPEPASSPLNPAAAGETTGTIATPVVTAGTKVKSGSEEARALDRQARIERLRQNGWRRKRFDAARYEELCEAVLAELA